MFHETTPRSGMLSKSSRARSTPYVFAYPTSILFRQKIVRLVFEQTI
uniref:Uncharacterized protein n=1 Tax=Arundo donax TaxID=35708 RepID=A0A0A9CJ10_ARUDO